MNPFLILALILTLGTSFMTFVLGYLTSNDTDARGILWIISFITCFIGAACLCECAHQWALLHPH